jgi:hypothetical protein
MSRHVTKGRTVESPEILAHCHQCGEQTGTAFKFMPAGIGNACAVCGSFRKGKPYISKAEFKNLMPSVAEGDFLWQHRDT